MSNDTSHVGTSIDVGIAEAVDDTRIIFQPSHQATTIAVGTGQRWLSSARREGVVVWQDTTVVYSGIAIGHIRNSAYGTTLVDMHLT